MRKRDMERAIKNNRPIAVIDGRSIWMYHKFSKGWVRNEIELSSPEAAERRADSLVGDFFILRPKTASDSATFIVDGLDKMLHPEVSNVKFGFILCGNGKEEPAVCACLHVLQGAPAKHYVIPIPYQGHYGEAFCADCSDGQAMQEDLFIICYHCCLRNQTSVRVTGTYVVVANDGENADITREVDGAEFHINRASNFADMSADEFRAKFPVDGITEIDGMVERPAASNAATSGK